MGFPCNSSSFSLLSLLVVLLLVGLSSQSPSVKETVGYDFICRKTANLDLCLEIFESDPRSAVADVKGLAQIADDACEASANQTLKTLGLLINSTMSSPILKERFETCVRYYDIVIANLDMAKRLLASPKYTSALDYSQVAKNYIDDCDALFQSSPISAKPAELEKVTKKSLDLVLIFRVILDVFLR
ncbi:hypothetical protein Vadar_014381 [Vaccinium darrowii]|uniref:Uncharacterized protein n=1 Tax=Vaccinium darrowii TaxID=229202 RepID=A0ACB7Z3L8_9ERIC|nr:hypothetical protein Vadar_014381 [Vaccinium darrowii]